jgi:hypothetical protein
VSSCGDCGHSREEHNEHGDCMHYDRGGCACFAFVTEAEATPQMRARRLFGRLWHSTATLKAAFHPGGSCQHQGCALPVVRRIMVNVWGTAIEFDVCDEHAQRYHGKLLDDFPAKRADEIDAPGGGA